MEGIFGIKKYSVVDFGARTGLGFDNQEFFQKAIDTCNEQGGGTVVIPKGYWLTSPIRLKSNVCLHAEDGAYVRFTNTKEKYPLYYTEYEGRRAIRAISPISAVEAHNIAITGEGTFDGNGNSWRPKKDWKMPAWEWQKKKTSPYIAEVEDGLLWFPTQSSYLGFMTNVDEKLPDALERASQFYDWYRPVFVSLVSCENVLLRGGTFTNSPNWTIHPRYCKNFTMENCYVKNSKEAQNSDGIDVDSCENVLIKDCVFDVGDDAICMKAGKGREARKRIAPTKNVEVCNCKVYRGHGGFVIGSEMSRGVENVYVHDCCFFTTDAGIRIKSAMGRGGYIKNIKIEKITMCEIGGDCITFSMGYSIKSLLDIADNITEYTPDDVPVFDGFEISDITCDSANRFLLMEGLDVSPVKNVAFSNCNALSEREVEIKNAENITFKNVVVNGREYSGK